MRVRVNVDKGAESVVLIGGHQVPVVIELSFLAPCLKILGDIRSTYQAQKSTFKCLLFAEYNII